MHSRTDILEEMLMSKALSVGIIVSLSFVTGSAFAFNGHVVSEGPLELVINDIASVTATDKPTDVNVRVANNGQSPLEVHLRMAGLVDEWYAVGETEKHLKIAPGRHCQIAGDTLWTLLRDPRPCPLLETLQAVRWRPG